MTGQARRLAVEGGFVAGRHAIEGYGGGGFRFAGMSHRGSILATPSGVRAWDPLAPGEVTQASLAALFAEPPGAIELLLVGMGQAPARLAPDLADALRAAGLRFDAMTTGAALSTYNILAGEGRAVAAALLATP